MKLGTLDFFFDAADQLEELGVNFTLVVEHPAGDGVVVLSNVQQAPLAGHMIRAMNRTFSERFPRPSGEDPNPAVDDPD